MTSSQRHDLKAELLDLSERIRSASVVARDHFAVDVVVRLHTAGMAVAAAIGAADRIEVQPTEGIV